MPVTNYPLTIMGSRAARLFKALADGKLTEFRVQQAVEQALDELMENPEFKQPDLGLEVAAEQRRYVQNECESDGHHHCTRCGSCEGHTCNCCTY